MRYHQYLSCHQCRCASSIALSCSCRYETVTRRAYEGGCGELLLRRSCLARGVVSIPPQERDSNQNQVTGEDRSGEGSGRGRADAHAGAILPGSVGCPPSIRLGAPVEIKIPIRLVLPDRSVAFAEVEAWVQEAGPAARRAPDVAAWDLRGCDPVAEFLVLLTAPP